MHKQNIIAEHRDENGELIYIEQQPDGTFFVIHHANVVPGEYEPRDPTQVISMFGYDDKETAIGAYAAEVADWLSADYFDEEPRERLVKTHYRCGSDEL